MFCRECGKPTVFLFSESVGRKRVQWSECTHCDTISNDSDRPVSVPAKQVRQGRSMGLLRARKLVSQ